MKTNQTPGKYGTDVDREKQGTEEAEYMSECCKKEKEHVKKEAEYMSERCKKEKGHVKKDDGIHVRTP